MSALFPPFANSTDRVGSSLLNFKDKIPSSFEQWPFLPADFISDLPLLSLIAHCG